MTNPGARTRFSGALSRYGGAALLVAAATVVAVLLRRLFSIPDVEMLYLLVVVIAGVYLGRGPSVAAAALGVVAYDFFFVPPSLTLAVEDARYILTFGMMFGVGLVVSTLAVRLRRERQEVRTREDRARAEEMRSSLLASVSHDLRTPLAALTGAATTLRADPALPAQTREDMLATICEEAERLERLVTNLLDMTRLDSGGVVVKREWVPVDELVGSALTRVEAKLAQHVVRVEVGGELPLVSVDPILVEQLLINLLDNAAKHTEPGTELGVCARVGSAGLTLEVKDRGPGLPAGEEEVIFDRFYRRARAGVPGAGLGLAICRAIARVHGGTLVARNRTGGGAAFCAMLPLVGEPPAAEAAE